MRNKKRLGGLRELLSMARSSETLQAIPESLANVIARYDNLDIQPEFRQDIYNILTNSILLAESLVDDTISVEDANAAAADQLAIIARLIMYLQTRPTKTGFSILIPSSKSLVGQFNTREEAEHQIEILRSMGSNADCRVVPIKISSLVAVQPRNQGPVLGPPPALTTIDNNPDPGEGDPSSPFDSSHLDRLEQEIRNKGN